MLLVLTVLSFIVRPNYGGQICGDCNYQVEPSYCTTVRECGDHEYCSVEKYLLGSTLRYDIGCKSIIHCNRRSSNIGQRTIDGRLVVCEECCNGTNLCSSTNGLCGSKHLDTKGGHICFKCDQMRSQADCNKITLCHSDQECVIHAPVIGKRDVQTRANTLCRGCCSGRHLCNKECSIQSHTSTSINETSLSTTTIPPQTHPAHKPPVITVLQSPSAIRLGTNVTLVCRAEGYPKPKINWSLRTTTGRIPSNVHADSNEVIIMNFQLSNYGDYACRASNDLGESDIRYTTLNPTH